MAETAVSPTPVEGDEEDALVALGDVALDDVVMAAEVAVLVRAAFHAWVWSTRRAIRERVWRAQHRCWALGQWFLGWGESEGRAAMDKVIREVETMAKAVEQLESEVVFLEGKVAARSRGTGAKFSAKKQRRSEALLNELEARRKLLAMYKQQVETATAPSRQESTMATAPPTANWGPGQNSWRQPWGGNHG